jgi:heme/copper-type cytochrome/quinol oxidase subunit 2
MSRDIFLWVFVATLGVAALVWAAMVFRLVRLSRPVDGGAVAPLRRVMGIELVWTLVPAAVAIALTVRVLTLSGW